MGIENNNSTTSASTSAENTVLRGRLQMAQETITRLQKDNEALRRDNARLQTDHDHVVSLETQVTFCMEDFRREKEEHEKAKARNAELQMELDIINRQLKSYQATTLNQLSIRRQAALDAHRLRYEIDHPTPTQRRPHSSYLSGGSYARDSPGVLQCDSAPDESEPQTNNHAGDYDEVDGAFAAPSSRGHSPIDTLVTIDGAPPPASRTHFRFGNARGSSLPTTDDVVVRSRAPSQHSSTSPRRTDSFRLSPLASPTSTKSQDSPSPTSSEGALECPRCHDKYPFELHVAFLDHIDVCTSY